MPRLRRSDPGSPGLIRRRRGRGFELLDPEGRRVEDPDVLARVNALVIPPAWTDVWISPDPLGHIQATGTDAAGRRQYRYHDDWHARRARRKFSDMERFAQALPALRERVEEHLTASDELEEDRVLACVVRLLDRGFFRIGCEGYAERNGTYGLATMRKEHVTVLPGDTLVFDYPAKHGIRRIQHVIDPHATDIVRRLKRRRGGGPELFAHRRGREWYDVRSEHINGWLKAQTGMEISAKDFRTWNATVLAAVAVAVTEPPKSKTARRRATVRAVKEVARYLGNTPAVCRSSYIDPRVFDRFDAGQTIRGVMRDLSAIPEPGEPATQGPIEAAVLDLLTG